MTTHSRLPRLAITMGDAAGIGPEIIVKAFARHEIFKVCRPFVIGDHAVINDHLRFWSSQASSADGTPPTVLEITTPEQVDDVPYGTIPLLQPGSPLLSIKPGCLSAEAGRGAVEYVKKAVSLAQKKLIDGIVTAPLNKEAMNMAGHRYPGHTEILAEAFRVPHYSLVLSAQGLFVFHVTTHVSLREALDLITFDRVLHQIRLAHLVAQAIGADGDENEGVIAVAGVNPHAGEGGLFGTEEQDIIGPAVEAAQNEGIVALGPLPADTMFPKAVQGGYRFIIAMYHDQGHAVFKSLFFDEGVNITAGLPVIRTSVDHGTAFDIAGQGSAQEESLLAAIEVAAELGPKWEPIWRQTQTWE